MLLATASSYGAIFAHPENTTIMHSKAEICGREGAGSKTNSITELCGPIPTIWISIPGLRAFYYLYEFSSAI